MALLMIVPLFKYSQDAYYKGFYLLLAFLVCFCFCIAHSELSCALFSQGFVIKGSLLQSNEQAPSLALSGAAFEGLLASTVISIYIALILTAPLFLHFLSNYYAPSLHQSEREISTTLFVCLCITIWVFYSLAIGTLVPSILLLSLSFIGKQATYLPGFISHLTLAIRALFGVHVLCALLCGVSYFLPSLPAFFEHTKNIKKHFHIAFFFISAVACPPDVTIQCSLWACFVLISETAVFMGNLSRAYRVISVD